MTATGRAFGITPQAIFGRLKRGTFPLQPVARAGKRPYFDKAQVERAAQIISANIPQ